MFWAAFLSATVLPGASEVLFAGLLVSGAVELPTLLAVATTGNTLGSVANWYCGRFLLHLSGRRWFPVSAKQLDRAGRAFARFGTPSLLFAWVPVVGDAITVVAGMSKVYLRVFVPLVAVGKLARYLAIAIAVSRT